MIREDRFVLSRKQYAVDLTSLDHGDHQFRSYSVGAVWYRRRRGVTVACIGTLWDFQDEVPPDAATFLTRHTDGRYGGRCEGRWDGTGYWGEEVPEIVADHLAILRPMLDAYPAIPPGFDGWWRFQTSRELREVRRG